ncbi:hypothetical protein [Mesorhizobium sp. M8A.F.Ca.ET.021.01.1.1]|uniref:hypothetical protein n=1 Tax=Mesorhizobium sp. M8A.F.Ca.ET.021.01.1.1 TaxID=2496757 RepID=UPI000FCA5177|nr:hypothetical protein [Mesorhizobium sp. M8A.F.Ca.ET.021.01.1.1]RUW56820.1 hypothetical protein EOA36_02145 [Mesorhizobium sp. M8A.F.Ca.ET.021.01.1.1]
MKENDHMPSDDMHEISLRPLAERWDSGERHGVDTVEIGQWYWVKHTVRFDGEYTNTDDDGHTTKHKKGDVLEWFGCVMEIGSNFVEIHAPRDRQGGYTSVRIHFDEFEERLRYEPNAQSVIAGHISRYQSRVNALLGEVREVTQRLGVVPTQRIEDKTGEATNALVAVTSQVDTKAYKNALIEAKDKTLPDLFKEIEAANGNLARWMMAPTMSVQASIGPMKKSIKVVEDRIYTLELYAGLTEEAVQVRKGDPADREEKLRLMQRRLYMDEECLVNYEAGGMEMKNIEQFDEWLARDENFRRLLPFDRCAVAFRVRRMEKEREGATLWQSFINIWLKDSDKTTFLYIRNGDQLWRINCEFDFGAQIVPDQAAFDPSRPMMVKMFASRIDGMIPRSLWEVMRDEELENERKRVEWNEQNPDKESRINNPYGWMGSSMRHKEYSPFDPSNVYYDEAMQMVSDEIKKYNRVAVIVQGLFDRSLVLHPHNPVRVWEPASFAANIEVIYDATTLTYGDKPDFEAYRARLNASISADSIVVGQEDFWMRIEAQKENDRQRRDYRNKNPSHYSRFRPYGNDGPGRVGPMTEWKPRANKAVFRWERDRKTFDPYSRRRGGIEVSVTVPASELLNVSAYTPGDFKQFFEDPRTRREYLKWAPLMLAAEDHLAGKTLAKIRDSSWVSE